MEGATKPELRGRASLGAGLEILCIMQGSKSPAKAAFCSAAVIVPEGTINHGHGTGKAQEEEEDVSSGKPAISYNRLDS